MNNIKKKRSFRCLSVEWLIRLLPARAKRMIFIISLMQLFKGPGEISDNTLNSANEIMKLGFSKESLRFPIHVHHLIWDGLVESELADKFELTTYRGLDKETIEAFITELNNKVPKWQRYGSDQEMKDDIIMFLENRASILRS